MEIKQEKLMTDGYIAGLNPKSGLQANVNLEDGEYIKTPDGSVAQVLGERHSKGGVDLLLPEMTAVLSDTKDLTLEKSQVKELKKTYGIEVSTKNTYSDVLDKYAKKIGLTKLLNEQEDAFTQLKKVTENALSEGSLNVNNRFLQKKIYDLQVGIVEKQNAMGNLFENLFAKQQEAKGEDNQIVPAEGTMSAPQEAVDPTIQSAIQGDLTEQQMMKFGGCVGCVDNLKTLAQKYNMTPSEAYALLEKNGKLPKFDGGGVVYNVFTGKNQYGEEFRDKRRGQKAGESAYGEVGAQQSIEYLYNNFPTILSSEKYKGLVEFKDGRPTIKKDINLKKENELIYKLQEDMNTQMKSSAEYILKDNSGRFSEEAKKSAQTYLEKETFTTDKTIDKGIRTFDSKLGEFTGGRYAIGLDLVTPEDYKVLQGLGKSTVQQLTPDDISKLSPESQRRINEIKPTLTQGEDFLISQIANRELESVTPKTTTSTDTNTTNNTGSTIEDNITKVEEQRRKFPRLFYTPDQSVPPPIGLQSESLEQIELQRLDPLRVGIEDQLKKLGDSRGFVASQLESLPPSQRSAMLANLIATSSAVESDAITKANQINTQNLAQTELYNASQADKETVVNAESRLNYEQRALRGLSNTQNEIHNYFMANREIYLNNYKEQINMNTINQLFPDVSLDNFGIGSKYDPSGNFQIQTPNSNYQSAQYYSELARQKIEEDKKKKESESK